MEFDVQLLNGAVEQTSKLTIQVRPSDTGASICRRIETELDNEFYVLRLICAAGSLVPKLKPFTAPPAAKNQLFAFVCEASSKIKIKIHLLPGTYFELSVPVNAAGSDIRAAAAQLLDQHGVNAPAGTHVLVWPKMGCKVLNSDLIGDLGIVDLETLNLILDPTGAKVDSISDPDDATSWQCPTCGLKNDSYAPECDACGREKYVDVHKIMDQAVDMIWGDSSPEELLLDGQPSFKDHHLDLLLPAIERSARLRMVLIGAVGLSENGIARVAAAAAKNPHVKSFELFDGFLLMDVNQAAIGACLALAESRSLESLELKYRSTLRDSAVKNGLVPLIRASKTLNRVSLAGCAVGPAGMKALADALCSSTSNVEEFDLDLCDQFPGGGEYLSQADLDCRDQALEGFFSDINSNSPLKVTTLNLGANTISGDAAVAICRFLASENCRVRDLSLANARIEAADLSHILLNGLAKNATVQRLDLSSLPLDGLNFSTMLKQNNTLHELDIQNTNLSARAIASIGAALSANESVRSINLCRNHSRPDAASIASTWPEAIAKHPNLRSLTMDITASTAAEIAAAVRKSPSLRAFCFYFSIQSTDPSASSLPCCVACKEGDDELIISTENDEDEQCEAMQQLIEVGKKIVARNFQ